MSGVAKVLIIISVTLLGLEGMSLLGLSLQHSALLVAGVLVVSLLTQLHINGRSNGSSNKR